MIIFTGERVEIAGFVIAAAAGLFLLSGPSRAGVLACLGVYLLTRLVPGLFRFLDFFAEVPAWPSYVSLALAAIFAGYAGGFPAVVVLIGLGTCGDGRMFDALY